MLKSITSNQVCKETPNIMAWAIGGFFFKNLGFLSYDNAIILTVSFELKKIVIGEDADDRG